jgi:hypothetical protein
MISAWWFVVAVLSLPHWLYWYVWTQPKHYMQLCDRVCRGKDYSDVFASLGYILKPVQFATFATWYLYTASPVSVLGLPLWRWVAVLVLGGAGQYLNVMVYKTIGKYGVYYGTRLGHNIKWYTGFPFNKGIPHPQYFGSVLTIWALAALLYTAAHGTPMLFMMLTWSLMYVFTSYIEQCY